MKCRIEVEMDNEAFLQDDPNAELARILEQIASQLRSGILTQPRDFNGNTVGTLEITQD